MKHKADYISEIAEITSRTFEEVEKEIIEFTQNNHVTVKDFYSNKLWEKSLTQSQLEAKRIVRRRNRRNMHYDEVAKALGITRKEARLKLRALNENNIYKVPIVTYANLELYRYSESEINEVLKLLVRRNELKHSLKDKLDRVDLKQLDYTDLDSEMEELYSIFRQLMPESLYSKLKPKLAPSRPDILENEERLRSVLVDMAATKFLLGFGETEYVAYHFAEKTLEEKHSFINDSERMKLLGLINDPDCYDYLDDKFKAYSLLSKYYHREMILVLSDDDLNQFRQFCNDKTRIVVKPYCDSMGRGIKPVDLKKETDILKLFYQLRKKYKSFIVEDIIIPHRRIRALNPDSVNTVRLITYFDGEKTILQDAFMKVGKRGSFVDNGSAGGILVSIDLETGKFKSDGCDKQGVIYKKHPDTGVRFMGYRLPRWRKVKTLALELASKVPGLCYIGWDFTYNNKGQWTVVEGNAKTQFFGQQCTTDIGVRREFVELVKNEMISENSRRNHAT